MENILTVDIEDWYQTHDFNLPPAKWNCFQDRVVSNTGVLLDLFAKYQTKGTFFVVGCIARQYPELVRRIAAEGHEIGSHGYWHKMINKMNREEFRKDLLTSKAVIEDITGRAINIYRAPSWSITKNNLWALEILEDEGFIYDSSIQPFQTPLSGMKGTPTFPFHPLINGRKLRLVEIPTCVLLLNGFRIPFAGGFYLRVVPVSFIKWALHKINENRAGMVYVHPWEVDPNQPVLKVPLHIRFIHYYNLSSTIHKLEQLLTSFSFGPLGRLIGQEQYPYIDIT